MHWQSYDFAKPNCPTLADSEERKSKIMRNFSYRYPMAVKKGSFLQFSDKSLENNVGIEWTEQVIYHPIDGLPCFGLAEVIAITSLMHILNRQFSGGDERLEVIKVVGPAGFHHRHRRQHHVDPFPDLRPDLLPKRHEGGAKDLVPFHRLARVKLIN